VILGLKGRRCHATLLCVVGGLVVTCVCVFLAYRYLTASSGEAEVERQKVNQREQVVEHVERKVEYKDQKVDKKQAKVRTSKMSDSGSIPANVLSKVGEVSVLEKTAMFTVKDQVRLLSSDSNNLQNL